jgi:hypothetical protein
MNTTHTPRPASRRRRRTAVAAGLAGAAVVLTPAAALASTPRAIHRDQKVDVHPMALAKGHTVNAQIDVQNPQSNVAGWWSRATVAKVVQKGVDGGYQSPYQSQGYRCTPVVRGETTSFTCRLRGADVPTTVTLKFNIVYRGDTASG